MKMNKGVLSIVTVFLLMEPMAAKAGLVIFNASAPGDNLAVRNNWLAAANIKQSQYVVDFETGFTNGQNVSGVLGQFPGGLVIRDTSTANEAIIRSGTGAIHGSSPLGVFALTQNERAFLELDFSANPIDYLGAFDIDQSGTSAIVTFVGGATASFSLETTGAAGDTAEFFGIYRNDLPRITKIQFDASGDGRWGLDSIQYGRIPEPGVLSLIGLGLAGLALSKRKVV